MKNNIMIGKKFKKFSAMDRKSYPFVIVLAIFPVLHVLLFYFYTSFSTIVLGFKDINTGGFTFDNMKLVFQNFIDNNDYFWGYPLKSMLGRSILIFVVSTAIGPIGWLTTYYLTKYLPGGNIFRALYTIPGIVGAVVFSSIMKDFYSYNGLITNFIKDLGFNLPIPVIREGLLGYEGTAFPTLLIQHCIYDLAGGSVILAGAYMRIPNELFESAQLDGCGLFRETFSIAVPCVWSTISTLMVFGFCGILTSDLNTYIYSNGTGAFDLNTLGFYVYQFSIKISIHPDNELYYSYISALGLCITTLTIPLVLFGKWLLTKINEDVEY